MCQGRLIFPSEGYGNTYIRAAYVRRRRRRPNFIIIWACSGGVGWLQCLGFLRGLVNQLQCLRGLKSRHINISS